MLEAIAAANTGHALAYGNDRWTAEATARLRDLFAGDSGRAVEALLVWNGTGANVMSLGSIVPPAQAVVCSAYAHIAVDETGAPERIVGSKLIDARRAARQARSGADRGPRPARGDMHHAQPEVLSITQ